MKESDAWESYSDKEIRDNQKKYCNNCVYGKQFSTHISFPDTYCTYILVEGHSRGCSAMNCKKFVRKGENKNGEEKTKRYGCDY